MDKGAHLLDRADESRVPVRVGDAKPDEPSIATNGLEDTGDFTPSIGRWGQNPTFGGAKDDLGAKSHCGRGDGHRLAQVKAEPARGCIFAVGEVGVRGGKSPSAGALTELPPPARTANRDYLWEMGPRASPRPSRAPSAAASRPVRGHCPSCRRPLVVERPADRPPGDQRRRGRPITDSPFEMAARLLPARGPEGNRPVTQRYSGVRPPPG